MIYDELLEARLIFNLSERATLREIKSRHRQLVKLHHPDKGGVVDPGFIVQINAAYAVLLDYVSTYRFSFTESEFYAQNPDEQLRRQFADPLWDGR